MDQAPPTSQQIFQLQNSLRSVFQKLNEERTRNDTLESTVEELRSKIRGSSLMKQEYASLQKNLKRVQNENKFLKIRLKVREKTTSKLKNREKRGKDGEDENHPGEDQNKRLKSASMNRMSRFLPFGKRRDSFALPSQQPSVLETRINKSRLRIKCKELKGRVHQFRLVMENIKKDLKNFHAKFIEIKDHVMTKTVVFSSNVCLPQITDVDESNVMRLRHLENEIETLQKKMRKTEWKFAVKQQKMLHQLGLLDFYSKYNEMMIQDEEQDDNIPKTL